MYVFSIKNNDLGFYHYSGTTIPKNKAYLHLPHTWEEIKNDLLPNSDSNPVKLNFGHVEPGESFVDAVKREMKILIPSICSTM